MHIPKPLSSMTNSDNIIYIYISSLLPCHSFAMDMRTTGSPVHSGSGNLSQERSLGIGHQTGSATRAGAKDPLPRPLKGVRPGFVIPDESRFNAWATTIRNCYVEEGFPEEVHLNFRTSRKLSPSPITWCSVTKMWHCQVGAELVVSLTPTPRELNTGSFTLSLSSAADGGTSGQESQLNLQKDSDSDVSSCTWTARWTGQLDFHARWVDGSPERGRASLGTKRNTRVFAKAARLCVHPKWHEAEASFCELRIESTGHTEAEEVGESRARGSRAWWVLCQLQLRSSVSILRCPSSVEATEVTGPSFDGVGPDTSRWKVSVSGLEVVSLKSVVDINRGIISFRVQVQALPASAAEAAQTPTAFLTIMERSSCLHVKSCLSPIPTLPAPPELQLSRTSRYPAGSPAEPVTPARTLRPLRRCLGEQEDVGGQRLESPKQRQIRAPAMGPLQSLMSRPDDEAKKEQGSASSSPSSSRKIQERGLLGLDEGKPSDGKTRETTQLAKSGIPKDDVPESLAAQLKPLSAWPEQVEKTSSPKPWLEQHHTDLSARRYMPTELLRHSGWSKKKKSKSKSPKKNRDRAEARSCW